MQMQKYHDLMENILANGEEITTERTGVGTLSIFGEQQKFNLSDGFPAITTKKLAWKSVVSELIWFLKGSSNVEELREILHGKENREDFNKKTIWDANYLEQALDLGYSNGEMGDIYGTQWRNFGAERLYLDTQNKNGNWEENISGVDQVKIILEEAKVNPQSRRLIVSAWNPKVIWKYSDEFVGVNPATLPPCHMMFQLRIVNGKLDLMWYQRSVDVFLGLAFNIASYALLTHMFSRILGLNVGTVIGTYGDAHIYKNHINQVKEQLSRDHFDPPKLWINPKLKTLEDFCNASVDDFKLIDYNSHSAIKASMAV